MIRNKIIIKLSSSFLNTWFNDNFIIITWKLKKIKKKMFYIAYTKEMLKGWKEIFAKLVENW